ncbi:hypothetical protein [Nocardia sp. NPDC050793]|uniref:hypothetical protein n=1 Tax=Nocardia sp. NPDC050793 TaxID=3155159 RepID=UPI0033E1ACF8
MSSPYQFLAQIPLPLQWALFGEEFPRGDVEAMLRSEDQWQQSGQEWATHRARIDAARAALPQVLEGQTGEDITDAAEQLSAALRQQCEYCEEKALQLRKAAAETEKAQMELVIFALWLLVELLLAFTPVGAAVERMLFAATRAMILRRLQGLVLILTMTGALQAGIDAGVQLVQIAKGTRDWTGPNGIDYTSILATTLNGAGAAWGGHLTGRLLSGRITNPLAREVSQAFGGLIGGAAAAAPITGGFDITPASVLNSLVSSITATAHPTTTPTPPPKTDTAYQIAFQTDGNTTDHNTHILKESDTQHQQPTMTTFGFSDFHPEPEIQNTRETGMGSKDGLRDTQGNESDPQYSDQGTDGRAIPLDYGPWDRLIDKQALAIFESAAMKSARPVNWAQLIGDSQILFLGEDHSNYPVREFLRDQAPALHEAGVKYLGVESWRHPIKDNSIGQSFHWDEAGYRRMRSAMTLSGIEIVPFDVYPERYPGGSSLAGRREEHMAKSIIDILQRDPAARVCVLVSKDQLRIDGPPGHSSMRQLVIDSGHPTNSTVFYGGLSRRGISHWPSTMVDVAARRLITRRPEIIHDPFVLDLAGYRRELARAQIDVGNNHIWGAEKIIHLPQRFHEEVTPLERVGELYTDTTSSSKVREPELDADNTTITPLKEMDYGIHGELPYEPPGYPLETIAVRSGTAVSWELIAENRRLTLFGIDQPVQPAMDYLAEQASNLRRTGFTHVGVVFPDHPVFERWNAGDREWHRYLSTEDWWMALSNSQSALEAFSDSGITVVPIGREYRSYGFSEESVVQHANTIDNVLRSNPDAKMVAILDRRHLFTRQEAWSYASGLAGPPLRDRLIEAGYKPVSIAFIGGSDPYVKLHSKLDIAARREGVGHETFLANLDAYRSAGGTYPAWDADYILHLPQYPPPSFETVVGYEDFQPGPNSFEQVQSEPTELGHIEISGDDPGHLASLRKPPSEDAVDMIERIRNLEEEQSGSSNLSTGLELEKIRSEFTSLYPDASVREYVEQHVAIRNNMNLLANELGWSVERTREHLKDELKAILEGADVAVRVTSDSLLNILADGRFKSIFETESTAKFEASWRAELESQWFGYPADLAPEMRPIYGYMRIDGEHPIGLGPSVGYFGTDLLSAYGDIQVILRKDILPRTTMCIDDSMGGRVSTVPSHVLDPRPESYGVLPTAAANPSTRIFSGVNREYDSADFRAQVYIEAQIHGSVSLADISQVIIPRDPSVELRSALEESGLDWRVLNNRTIAIEGSELDRSVATRRIGQDLDWLDRVSEVGRIRVQAEQRSMYYDARASDDLIRGLIDAKRMHSHLSDDLAVLTAGAHEAHPDPVPDLSALPPIADLLDYPHENGDLWLLWQLTPLETTYGTYRIVLDDTYYIQTIHDGIYNVASFIVNGTITDRSDAIIGEFSRQFYRDKFDRLVVYNCGLKLHPEARGQRFSIYFAQALENWYRRSGVDRIILTAGDEKGGYVWAVAGFDWDVSDPVEFEKSISNVKVRIEQIASDTSLAIEDKRKIADLLQRFAGGPADYPSPHEIAMTTGTNGRRLGKEILLGSQWDGMKKL